MNPPTTASGTYDSTLPLLRPEQRRFLPAGARVKLGRSGL